ncbi:hypothetical protein CLCR_02133 [Cladophialophora carrionii]|uniref:Uncharacterized protein n=1 Tax=Cladophialophora carrionii TaxID=86049 RepID=A0A1C1CDA6_9EURO|nr:hypothetical protein CLCR_02133 [Cladophialophora carrionii]
MTNETVTYGRGGAGNVTTKDAKSPAFKPQTTPTLKSHVYTTGRGGTGNMARLDSPEEARRAQDVDVPGITIPENVHHTGRGGAANLYKPTEAEQKEARAHNEKVRSESFSKDRSGLRGLAGKAKDNLVGKSNGEKE